MSRRASLAWVVSDRWLQVVVSMDRADSQQGPYLGRLAFRDNCWYWDCPDESAVGLGGERGLVSGGRDNSNKVLLICHIMLLM